MCLSVVETADLDPFYGIFHFKENIFLGEAIRANTNKFIASLNSFI